MRPIRLGVIFDQRITVGGGFQQSLNAVLLTKKIQSSIAEVYYFTTYSENIILLQEHGISSTLLKLSKFQKTLQYLRRRIRSIRFLKFLQVILGRPPIEKVLFEKQIDLVYFLSPSAWANDLEELNYIITVWDICFRDQPEFPEVRSWREFERRDRRYRSIVERATVVLVDSDYGKKNLLRFYCISSDRVQVMPFEAAVMTRQDTGGIVKSAFKIGERYKLNFPYVFYPAHFWPHKNHAYLLEGLKVFELLYNRPLGAIFSGLDQGNLSYVESRVHELGLADRVRFAGFIKEEELKELYLQSVALVMPSYFGPTNLPPLEAFELGVPVLYSNLPGLREQVGDAALLLDLGDPFSLANHLNNLMTDELLRKRLILAGHRLLAHGRDNRSTTLEKIIEDFRWKRLCWK